MKRLFLFVCITFLSISANCQTSQDMTLIIHGDCGEACVVSCANDQNDNLQNNSVIKTLLKLPIFIYREFISSQMKPICKFHPSCSEFSIEAINQFGLPGIMLGADRFMRCNNFAEEKYPLHESTGQLFDPVEHYKLFRKNKKP